MDLTWLGHACFRMRGREGVVLADPPYGFKGPVMAPAPTGADAVRLWDAIQVISEQPGFFEITRPRANRPIPPDPRPEPR